jgi:orotate phosphoribosyltransferase-like protein
LKKDWKGSSRLNKISSFIAFYEAQLKKNKEKKNKIIWIDDEVIFYLTFVVQELFKELTVRQALVILKSWKQELTFLEQILIFY